MTEYQRSAPSADIFPENSVAADLSVQYGVGEDGVSVTCGYAYDGEPLPGIEIVELPAEQLAACAVHLGPMDGISRSWMALMTEATERGLTPSGPCRELYLRAEREGQADWVTELQQPVTRA